MKIVDGDLWDFHERGWRVVVTTNIGWDPVTMRNNMGAGMALQAEQRWPRLPRWYGLQCAEKREAMPVVEHKAHRLVFLPVKPLLDIERPERSWNQRASVPLIARGLAQLAVEALDHRYAPIALSFPGCGNGGLLEADVLPVLDRVLGAVAAAERVQLVRYKATP